MALGSGRSFLVDSTTLAGLFACFFTVNPTRDDHRARVMIYDFIHIRHGRDNCYKSEL